MQKLVSLLLIPLCLMGQFFCPHSHHGTGVAEPSGHSARPHIHLSGGPDHRHGHTHHHHGHRDSDADHAAEPTDHESATPLTDHDRDALYFSCPACDSRIVVAKQTLEFPPAAALWSSDCASIQPHQSLAAHFDPPDESWGLPLYLRISSLRI